MASDTTAATVANGANTTSAPAMSSTAIVVKRFAPLPPNFLGIQNYHISVQLLDDRKFISNTFKKDSTGQDVIDYICKQLSITEKDYFGLRTQDANKNRYWIDPQKSLAKQFSSEQQTLRFRVRFYPIDPQLVGDPIARYQLFVQLQRDLIHGRLSCPSNEASELGALILQASLGDYEEEAYGAGSEYVSSYIIVLKQSKKLEDAMAARHKELKGMSQSEAEIEFLRQSSTLETYGFDPYIVKDHGSQDVAVGANTTGILCFTTSQKVTPIKWKEIQKVDYTGKYLSLMPAPSYFKESEGLPDGEIITSCKQLLNISADGVLDKSKLKKVKFVFTCPSPHFAKHLWRHILSQHAFYTAESARTVKPKFSKPRIPLFLRGSTFRCPSGRVQNEMRSSPSPSDELDAVHFERYPLQKLAPRSQTEPWNGAVDQSHDDSPMPNFGRIGTPIIGNAAATPDVPSMQMGSAATNGIAIAAANAATTESSQNAESPSSSAEHRQQTYQRGLQQTFATSDPSAEEERNRLTKANGLLPSSTSRATDVRGDVSIQSKILHWSLIVAFISILGGVLSIVVMEMTDDSPWLRSFPQLIHFKRNYYNPFKMHVKHR